VQKHYVKIDLLVPSKLDSPTYLQQTDKAKLTEIKIITKIFEKFCHSCHEWVQEEINTSWRIWLHQAGSSLSLA